MSYQKMTVIGNLGREPEMRFTPNGQPVCNFSVAATRVYPGADGEQKKETAWFRVTVWGKMAESCNKYLKKGSKVFVEGRLVVDPANGGPKLFKRQDGSTGASFEINAQEVKFLSSKNESDTSDGEVEIHGSTTSDDDIPF